LTGKAPNFAILLQYSTVMKICKQLKAEIAQSKRVSTEFTKAHPDQMPLNPEEGG
jgi:hypothetical protein